MGGVPSGDSCTVMVREEGVEETREGIGAPGRSGGGGGGGGGGGASVWRVNEN